MGTLPKEITTPIQTSLTGAGALGGASETSAERPKFVLTITNFEGPFDLLLSLINSRKLDITEVALAEVTDEFIAYVHTNSDLSFISEFIVVAATLLDLKVARLLPGAEVDEEDLALLEARDLLFAKLLQYRAFKEVSTQLRERLGAESDYRPRNVSLEPHFAALLPQLRLDLDATDLARLAAGVFSAKPPAVALNHLHAPLVPVAGQVEILRARFATRKRWTFRELIADAQRTAVIVSRFLALLELYRGGVIAFDQPTPLEELHIRVIADPTTAAAVDDYEG